MTKHMSVNAAALAHTSRNPPKVWKLKALPFKRIPAEVAKAGFPRPTPKQVKRAAARFGDAPARRGRKAGWRKGPQDYTRGRTCVERKGGHTGK